MSGRDERPTFKVTKENWFKLCPNCHESDTYNFTKAPRNIRWGNRVGYIRWGRYGFEARLEDFRNTVNSIGKKYLMCNKCNELISFDTKMGTMMLELFKDTMAEQDGIWRRTLEKARKKKPIKVWWKVTYPKL